MLKSKNLLIVSFFVSFITLLVYLPALQNDFVNWDDNEYIYDNPYIQSFDLKSIKWMFTAFHAANWHPLAWLSHAIDYAVWNLNPMGHHLTSIVLHGLNTFLVVILITQLVSFGRNNIAVQIRYSKSEARDPLLAGIITGLLFGLHPLHVESVAWVSERKDVLYAFFFLLSILTYLKYTSSSGKRGFFYSACLFFFILSLMSKPMAVTLPAVLILLDWYPLKRFEFKLALTSKRRVLIEKLPFFVLSLITSVLTFMAQQAGGSVATIETLSFVKRMLIAVRALGFYLLKILWPLNLAPFYPYPSEDSMLIKEFIMASIVVFLITAFCIYLLKRQRVWSVVWVYYL
ncbi:MAG: hypothetical protein JSV71_06355, partial [Nitrospiraceae bacterium]